MRIGILGSGLMGGKLGTLLARAGHDVIFSYARHRGKLARLAQQAGSNARAGTPRDAVQGSDVIVVAVHWSRLGDVLSRTGSLAAKVIVSCSLPMNRGNTGLVLAHSISGAEALAKKLPQSRVVSAFNTIPSEVLFGVFRARKRKVRPGMVYCGDDRSSKRIVARLIRDVGFDPVDAGPLWIARYTEPFALLVAQLAYEGSGGPEIAYKFLRYKSR